jgi:hypothetical protein
MQGRDCQRSRRAPAGFQILLGASFCGLAAWHFPCAAEVGVLGATSPASCNNATVEGRRTTKAILQQNGLLSGCSFLSVGPRRSGVGGADFVYETNNVHCVFFRGSSFGLTYVRPHGPVVFI